MQAMRSQLLGTLDSLYYLASKLSFHRGGQFFCDGYGDVEETVRIKKLLDGACLALGMARGSRGCDQGEAHARITSGPLTANWASQARYQR